MSPALKLAIAQIQRPSFWNNIPASQPTTNPSVTAKARAKSRVSYIDETLATLKRIGQPYLFADLRDYLGLSKSRMSSIVEELAALGFVAKIYRGDKLFVGIVDASAKYEPALAKPSKNDIAAAHSQKLILEAVRAGCDRIEDLPKATGLSLATCKKHWLKFKADGVLKAVPIPNTNNHIRIVPC